MVARWDIVRKLVLDVTDEPNYTCPKIDGVQIELQNAADVLDIIKNDLMEKIREANADIRAWGEAWKTKAIDLAVELQEARERIEELENQSEEITVSS